MKVRTQKLYNVRIEWPGRYQAIKATAQEVYSILAPDVPSAIQVAWLAHCGLKPFELVPKEQYDFSVYCEQKEVHYRAKEC